MAKKTGRPTGRPRGEPKVYKTAAVRVQDWQYVQQAWSQFEQQNGTGSCSFTDFTAWLIRTHPAVQRHLPQPCIEHDSAVSTSAAGTENEQEVLASA